MHQLFHYLQRFQMAQLTQAIPSSGDPEAKIIFSYFLLPFSHEAEQFILIVSKE